LEHTADGKIIETNFEQDDFNVYPPHNATTYPGQGAEFTVRYPIGFSQASASEVRHADNRSDCLGHVQDV
jgi:hypothetical protein